MRTPGRRETGLCVAEHPPTGNILACRLADTLPAYPTRMTLFHPEDAVRRKKVLGLEHKIIYAFYRPKASVMAHTGYYTKSISFLYFTVFSNHLSLRKRPHHQLSNMKLHCLLVETMKTIMLDKVK